MTTAPTLPPIVVIVSSPSALASERRAVEETLHRIRETQFSGMEYFGSRSGTATEESLAEVDRATVYIGLIGDVYGSVTEAEYDRARQRKLHCLVYVQADQTRFDDRSRVFLHKVMLDGIWEPYSNADELGRNVATDLHRYIVDSFVIQERERTSRAPTWRWPSPWDFGPYVATKRRGFIGRDWLFQSVHDWLVDPDAAQALLIVADFGVGKSAFLSELEAGNRGFAGIVSHYCYGGVNKTLSPAVFVRSVATRLADQLPAYKERVELDCAAQEALDDADSDPSSAFERAVLSPLHNLPAPSTPLVVIVDALDEALDFAAPPGSSAGTIVGLLVGLATRLPTWVRILATSRRRQSVLQPLRQAFRTQLVDAEDSRNVDDIRAYTEQRCRQAALAGILATRGESAIDFATWLASPERSGGKFLYVVRVLNDIESGALGPERLRALPPGLDGFYLDAFSRRFPDAGDYELTRQVLTLLCASREPMTREELASALGIAARAIQQALGRIEDFLTWRERRCGFDHASLADWLTSEDEAGFARAGPFAVAVDTGRESLATWANREARSRRAHTYEYLVRHLVEHLRSSERSSALSGLLLEWHWLDARLRIAGINALLADWRYVDPTPALVALQQALRQGAHVLAGDPDDTTVEDQLAPQILGRLQQRTELELQQLCANATAWLGQGGGLRPVTASLRAPSALHRTIDAHQMAICALVALPDGRLISSGHDDRLKIWNTDTGECQGTLRGHKKAAVTLAVLPDGRVASGSWDGTIKIWDIDKGVCTATLGDAESDSSVHHVVALASGKLAGCLRDRIQIWNVTTGECELTWEAHWPDPVPLADGRLAATVNDSIMIWDASTGACEATLGGHSMAISGLAVLDDGRLVSACARQVINVWTLKPTVSNVTLEGFHPSAAKLVALPGAQFALASHSVIDIWDASTGVRKARLQNSGDDIDAVARLPDGRLATGSNDGSVQIWDVTSADEPDVRAHTRGTTALAALPDGRLASANETIDVWDAATGACERTFALIGGWIVALAVSSDHDLVVGRPDGTVELCDLKTGSPRLALERRTRRLSHHPLSWTASCLIALSDGRFAIGFGQKGRFGSPDGSKGIQIQSTGGEIAFLVGHDAAITSLAVLGDGRLVSGGHDGTVRIWNLAMTSCELTLDGHAREVNSLAVLPDGRLASGSADNTIRIWSSQTGDCLAVLDGHGRGIWAMLRQGDGEFVQLWKPTLVEGELFFPVRSHPVDAIAPISTRRLASAGRDARVRIWENHGDTWKIISEFVADAPIDALAYFPRHGILAAGARNGRVHFLALESPAAKSRS